MNYVPARPAMDPYTTVRFHRRAEMVHRQGARSLAELLIQIANDTGQTTHILERLDEYSRFSVETVSTAGGDKFPPVVQLVPR